MAETNVLPANVLPAPVPIVGYEATGDMPPLWAALALAQAAYLPVLKTSEVRVRGEKASYDHRFAPLDEILEKTRPGLTANGLSFIQLPCHDGTGWLLKSILAHASGASIICTVPLPETTDMQKLGGNITYMRRYTAGPMLGVAAEEDNDGGAEGTQSVSARAPMGKTQGSPPAADKPKPAPKETPATQRAQQPSPNQGQAVAAQLGLQASGPVGPTPEEVDATYKRAAEAKRLAEERAQAAKPASVPPPAPAHDAETGEVDGPITKETLRAMRDATKAAKGPDGVKARFEGKDAISQWVMATFGIMPSEITELVGRQVIARLNEGT